MNFTTIITFLNILVMGAAGVGFIYNKTDAAKFDPAPIVERIGKAETMNAVQDTQIQTMGKDISEIKKDVKEIKQLFYELNGFGKPAIAPKNASLITGVKTSGEP